MSGVGWETRIASVTLEQCCRASFDLVLVSCKKFVEKPVGIHDDKSEETIIGFVAATCQASVTLVEALHCDLIKSIDCIVNALSHWSIAREHFGSLNFPTALVRMWVKINGKCLKNIDFEDNAPTLYSMLSKSTTKFSKKTICIVLEQELLAYGEIKGQYADLCRRMQLRLMNFLLLDVYDEDDHLLQKSRILIWKGQLHRAFGILGLNECIQCLSDAISVFENINVLNDDSSNAALIRHQLAVMYWLRALCNQEAHSCPEVIFLDIGEAIQSWSGIQWSSDVHQELVTGDIVPLLFCLIDLLSLKGYLSFQYSIFKLIITFLMNKGVSLEKCIAMLWADRRVTHSLCISPIDEDFITKISQHSGTNFDSVGLWVSCTNYSLPLQIGFRQKFSLYDTLFPILDLFQIFMWDISTMIYVKDLFQMACYLRAASVSLATVCFKVPQVSLVSGCLVEHVKVDDKAFWFYPDDVRLLIDEVEKRSKCIKLTVLSKARNCRLILVPYGDDGRGWSAFALALKGPVYLPEQFLEKLEVQTWGSRDGRPSWQIVENPNGDTIVRGASASTVGVLPSRGSKEMDMYKDDDLETRKKFNNMQGLNNISETWVKVWGLPSHL
ncbi:hypothetical protein GIB67_025721 [Kingdonia uniflora]|uniref:Uncharacterized protein n=1 Tax=Kingdonia uniflora TaxID=39325 RepID=A0A7J7KW77_9MAGN|nr:hypothetical protein GIB67_025721 [Kingdonia uniflora]